MNFHNGEITTSSIVLITVNFKDVVLFVKIDVDDSLLRERIFNWPVDSFQYHLAGIWMQVTALKRYLIKILYSLIVKKTPQNGLQKEKTRKPRNLL